MNIKTFQEKLSPNGKLELPGGSDGKESSFNAGNLGLIPGWWKRPWRREWQLTPIFLPEKFHGQRSLADYSSWGCKELDMTKLLTHTHTHTHNVQF